MLIKELLIVTESTSRIDKNHMRTPEDYDALARKHFADGQKGTRAGAVYAATLSGRARRAAKILRDGGSQEAAWKHYQGTDLDESAANLLAAAHQEQFKVGDSVKIKSSGRKGIITGISREYGMIFVELPAQTALHPENERPVMVHQAHDLELVKEGIGEPEQGWCLVMANGKVTGTVCHKKSDARAQQKRAPVATEIKWGKRAGDGSGDYVKTMAVDPIEEAVYATDSQKLKNMPDLAIHLHKSPYEGAERGEYTQMFRSKSWAQQFAKFIISQGGTARIGQRGQDMYVYHKGAGPISDHDFRMTKMEEGIAQQRFDEPLTGYHIVYKTSGTPVFGTPSFETKDAAQKYLMTRMFANHQNYEVRHTAHLG